MISCAISTDSIESLFKNQEAEEIYFDWTAKKVYADISVTSNNQTHVY